MYVVIMAHIQQTTKCRSWLRAAQKKGLWLTRKDVKRSYKNLNCPLKDIEKCIKVVYNMIENIYKLDFYKQLVEMYCIQSKITR